MLKDLFCQTGSPIGALPSDAAELICARVKMRAVQKGETVAYQGEPHDNEVILLSGQAVSVVTDAEGRSVCVGLHHGPCVITPHIARTIAGESLVTLEITQSAEVAQIREQDLQSLMVADEDVRRWGNSILHDALIQKSAREWSLAALDAASRLAWFRAHYNGYEEIFAHKHIASYLGMTPVTLSRLRAQS